MKKTYRFGIVLLSIFGALFMTAHSFALISNEIDDASFNISQAKTYYLKGDFNSWAASSNFLFTDNTAEMGEETDKIGEYVLENVELGKDDGAKVWDSNNYWYTQGTDNVSYSDKWHRSPDNGANYVVPMSGSYNVYLKFYSTNSTQIYLTTPDFTELYLKPNANWLSDGARFAAYFFNDELDKNEWHDMVLEDGYYKVAIPDDYINVIFCRMDPDASDNNWENKWNQTSNLSFDVTGYQNAYEISENGWDNSGNWSSK